ncbi:MAG: M48 family metallopeptidase [Geitlerinemataceae cyanobacterium]
MSRSILRVEHLDVGGIAIEVQRKAVKNISLRVSPPDGRVRIGAPDRYDLELLREFATSKLPWIERQRAKIRDRARPAPRQYVRGETHHYRGQPYQLDLRATIGPERVELEDASICLHVRPDATAADRERLLYAWYRQQLKALLPPLVERWEPVMGVSVREARIKRMKTKWGTCNIQARRIWLNLELIRLPPRSLEYVVVHEMTHLLERLHNDRFHGLLDRFFPDWRQVEAELDRIAQAA